MFVQVCISCSISRDKGWPSTPNHFVPVIPCLQPVAATFVVPAVDTSVVLHGNETLQNSLPVTPRLDSTHFNVDNNGYGNGTQLNITDVSALQDTTLGVEPTAVLVMLHESSIRDTAPATFADDDNAAQSQLSVTYRVISKGSTKMWDHLMDSTGHSYTMKPTNRSIKY